MAGVFFGGFCGVDFGVEKLAGNFEIVVFDFREANEKVKHVSLSV